MHLASTTTALFEEAILLKVRRLAGFDVFRQPAAYFDPGELRPTNPGYFDAFDRIHDDFERWLDPGEVAAPAADEIQRRRSDVAGDLLSFPSPRPSGVAAVDRVVLRLFPPPAGAPEVGVLFHHCLGIRSWFSTEWLMKPLARRFRVAAMVAPHHLMRSAPGMTSGEGFINPNPRSVLAGFRQWQADHRAALELLRRDHGFAATVVVGYSLGAYGTLLHRLIRPPLPTVVLCTTNHYARGILEGSFTTGLARRKRQAGFDAANLDRATRSLHLGRWGRRISGERLTWIYARDDRIEPGDSLRAAREAIAPERLVEVGGGHATAIVHRGRLAAEVARRVAETLDEGAVISS